MKLLLAWRDAAVVEVEEQAKERAGGKSEFQYCGVETELSDDVCQLLRLGSCRLFVEGEIEGDGAAAGGGAGGCFGVVSGRIPVFCGLVWLSGFRFN
ncbi:hypothetical protein Droror1_Dr00012011 [Drosera rotundifolia]